MKISAKESKEEKRSYQKFSFKVQCYGETWGNNCRKKRKMTQPKRKVSHWISKLSWHVLYHTWEKGQCLPRNISEGEKICSETLSILGNRHWLFSMNRFCRNQIKSITFAGYPDGLEKLEKLENRVFPEKKSGKARKLYGCRQWEAGEAGFFFMNK